MSHNLESDVINIKIDLMKGPLFIGTAAMLTLDHDMWLKNRIKILEVLAVMAHKREKAESKEPLEWSKYKSVFYFWFLIDKFYTKLYRQRDFAQLEKLDTYSERLGLYIRTFERLGS